MTLINTILVELLSLMSIKIVIMETKQIKKNSYLIRIFGQDGDFNRIHVGNVLGAFLFDVR